MSPVALVVQSEARRQERIASWLEDAGFEVMECPGPRAPTYACVGGRRGSCPLVAPADVVVLDLRLESEDVMEGTSAAELLALYTSAGKPVVVWGPDTSIARVFPDVRVVAWPSTPAALVGSALSALARNERSPAPTRRANQAPPKPGRSTT